MRIPIELNRMKKIYFILSLPFLIGIFLFIYLNNRNPYSREFTGHICDCWRKVKIPYVKGSKPFEGVFPRANFVDKEKLYIIDIRKMNKEMRFLARVFAGLSNRKLPPSFLILDEKERFYNLFIKDIKRKQLINEDTLLSLVREYFQKGYINGCILYDGRLWLTSSHILNVVRTLCGVEDAVPLTPSLNKRLNLPVIVNTLEKRIWKKDATMSYPEYQWAFHNLWKECYHHVLAYIPPGEDSPLTDYIVQFKLFTFYLPSEDKRTEKLFEYILSHSPPNTAVIGVITRKKGWEGKMEKIRIMRIMSKFGKFFFTASSTPNLSYYTGLRSEKRPALKQKKQKKKEPEKKRYISFVLTTGNSLDVMIKERWYHWNSKHRGKIPVGWAIPLGIIDLFPSLIQFYYRTAENTDFFLADTSGIGEIYPFWYGKIYGEKREEGWREYLSMTSHYMRLSSIDTLWTAYHDRESESKFLLLSPLSNLIYGLEGAHRYLNSSSFISQKKCIFFPYFSVKMKYDLKTLLNFLPRKLPSFILIGLDEKLYADVDILKEIELLKENLPEDTELVRPDELFSLYREAVNRGWIKMGTPQTKWKTRKKVTVRKVRGKINIDGNLKEWSYAEKITIREKNQVKWGKSWQGPQDISGEIYLLHDGKYLYLGAVVHDEMVSTDRNPLVSDGIEIYVDKREGRFHAPSLTQGFYDFIITVNGKLHKVYPTFDMGLITPGWGRAREKISVKRFARGYTIEAQIPLLNFQDYPYTSPLPKSLYLDIALNDKDGFFQTKIFWEGSLYSYPGIICGMMTLE